ncbi:MAG: hypothetical protein J6R27_03445 [Muribaculaceae bacterium]|nr:hypothetical protein [Muribaculaceae bacterium]
MGLPWGVNRIGLIGYKGMRSYPAIGTPVLCPVSDMAPMALVVSDV